MHSFEKEEKSNFIYTREIKIIGKKMIKDLFIKLLLERK